VPPNAGPSLDLHRRQDESFYVLAGTYEFAARTRPDAAIHAA
jgi:hypothetical protein